MAELIKKNYAKYLRKAKSYPTLKAMLLEVAAEQGNVTAYRQIVDSKSETTINYEELLDNVNAIGTALISRGLKGKHIAIIGECSIEWMESYLAVVCGTGVAIPIDKELALETLALQINFSDSEAVVFSGSVAKRIADIRESCPQVKEWILMRPELSKIASSDENTLVGLLNEGHELLVSGERSFLDAQVNPEDLCDIIFTSGTTGANKGVMLSHKNICTVAYGSAQMIKTPPESFSVLPINHAYEKNCNILGYLGVGKTVCINDDMRRVTKNIKRFQPGFTIMVPMILETIERRIMMETKKDNLDKHLQYGVWFSNLIRKVGIDKREKYFNPILSFFGPNLRNIVSGGAPLREETRKFYDNIGVQISNGYGISECGPLVSANFSDYQRPGSVGYIMPGCEVRIANKRENGDGEILVRGDNVMMGYYKDEKSTKMVFTDDGWLKTGDLGHLDSDGFLYVSGRLKNLIILSNGKNVSPEEVEDLVQQHIPYVREIVAYADEDGVGICATCYLDPTFLEENHVEDPYAYLMADIKDFNQTMPSFKRISNVLITQTEFDKTTTQKIRRFKVEKLKKTS